MSVHIKTSHSVTNVTRYTLHVTRYMLRVTCHTFVFSISQGSDGYPGDGGDPGPGGTVGAKVKS